MIPKADIIAWRQFAPGVTDAQVEQDLIINRVLVAIFKSTLLAEQLAFRGGMALHMLYVVLATKLRALYQRRKGRDLFSLWLGITEGKEDVDKIIPVFKHYMETEGQTVKSMNYEKNLQEKMSHRGFLSDLNPLLPADTKYDVQDAYHCVRGKIIDNLSYLRNSRGELNMAKEKTTV
jgi:predicted nucleotidyltransferase component of viral defense system